MALFISSKSWLRLNYSCFASCYQTTCMKWHLPHFVVHSFSSTCLNKRNSSYMSKIPTVALSAYVQHLQKLFLEVSSLKASSIKSYSWPPILFDELGGKSNLALDKLQSLVPIAQQLQKLEEDYKEMSNLSNEIDVDQDFLSEVESEMTEIKTEIENLKLSLVDLLVEDKEVEQCDGAILEVRAGVGGDEAMLFAYEIYEMYRQFCDLFGFDVKEIVSESENGSGLLKASCIITSPDGFAYSLLRHEVGVHRVQRVPKTESRGRMHTSTVSVAVIPKHDVSSFEINPSDIKKQFTHSPGGGGQHVNKTLSCAIVHHVPTNTQVRCHSTRNPIDNLALATEQLKQILYKRSLDEKLSHMNSIRSTQIRNRERSDKIRTYNYQHDRVTDHRIGITVNKVSSVLSGGTQFVSLLKELDEKYRNDDKVVIMNALFAEAGIR